MDIKSLVFFNQSLTLFIIFPAILVLGIYLTWKLRFVQVTRFRYGLSCLLQKQKGDRGDISRFGAISAVLAGNFGTGNISGMAVAIATGGPGALVWMWVMAFLAAAIQYTSCILGVLFRKKTQDGEYVGGPMYYLRDGAGHHKLALVFALFTILGSITVGNFAQINSVLLPLEKMGISSLYCSFAIAVLVGVVILGGIRRIAHFAAFIVPFQALVYFTAAFVILCMHYEKIPSALLLMFQSAFDFSSVTGGILGMALCKAITTGFDRGLFATDAGTGIVPILQASARSNNPIDNGSVTLIAPIMVMIVCTMTGLVLLVTGAWQVTGLQSTNMITHAFTTAMGPLGSHIVIISLILFAYTTILAWAYCGEKALGFLAGPKKGKLFRFFYVLLIPLGNFLPVEMIWTTSDLSITLMLLINLIGVIQLSPHAIALSSHKATKSEELVGENSVG